VTSIFLRTISKWAPGSDTEFLRSLTELYVKNLHGMALGALARACPLLKSLIVHQFSTQLVLDDSFSLPRLESLEIRYMKPKLESYLSVILRGCENLRELTIGHVRDFLHHTVLMDLPPSMERFSAKTLALNGRVLGILGQLPNLEDLSLGYCRGMDWMRLHPAASRLSSLRIFSLNVCDEAFGAFIPTLARLHTLHIESARGNCEELLNAISSLDFLEDLKLCGPPPLFGYGMFMDSGPQIYLESEVGLLHLAQGNVKNSLVECRIELTIGDEIPLLRKRLLKCFKTRIEPLLESRGGKIRKLILKNIRPII